MACSPPLFAYSVHGSSGNFSMQIDATNTPLFCENEFSASTTAVQGYGPGWSAGRYNPADGLHGPAPLVAFFSAWRISVPISDAFAAAPTGGVAILGAGPAGTTTYCLPLPTPTPQAVTVVSNTATPILVGFTEPTITCPGASGNSCQVTYAVTVNPANGTLTGTVPNLVYTPNAGFTGTDTFTFSTTACGLTTTAVVTITVVANVPAPPGGCL